MPDRTVEPSGNGLDPIDVRTWGEAGPTLVVLHGGPGAPGSAATLARELAAEFRVLEPLQRRSGVVPLTVDRHVADLAEIAPPHALLIGHSWGAMLALSFGALFPDRVRAIALVGCGTYDEASRAAYARAMEARADSTAGRRLAELGRRLRQTADVGERDRLFAEMGRSASVLQAVELVDDEGAGLPGDAAGYAETWADVVRLQRAEVEPARFVAIRCPVTMFHGRDDPHPGPAIRDVLRRVLPGLGYVEFAACGHEPWRERAARESFLAALRSWAREHAV